MKKRDRLILLIFCVILFFSIAPLVILYSQGYRFDFDEKKIVATGGVYIQVSNGPADIYLDGNFIRKTGFLSNTALIKNLLPKKHSIEIKKTGFWPWQKTLKIEEKKATEIKNILLIKKDLSFNVLAQEIDEFLVSQNGRKMLLKEEGKEEKWVLEELSLETGTKRKILEEKDLAKLSHLPIKIAILKWDSPQNRVLIQVTSQKKISYFLLDYSPQVPVLSKLDFLDEKAENISFNPKNNNEIFYSSGQVMFKTNLQSKKGEPQVFLNNLISFKLNKDNIIWLSTSGFLFKSDYSGQIKEVLNRKPFFIQKDKEYKIETQDSKIFLLENSDLYYLSPKGSFEKILEETQGIKFSSDSKRVVFWNNYEIWILELESEYKKVFLTRFSKKIGDCFWLTPYYLIFNVGEDEIKISEIDNRDRLNIVNLKNFKYPKIFYNKFNKKLYILSQKSLFSSEPVVP